MPNREPVWHPFYLALMFTGLERVGIGVAFMWMYHSRAYEKVT